MAIYRNKTQQFTIVAQAIMRDDRLSLKDTGLLVRLLSLPDNWEFSENGLLQIFKNDGQTSVRTGLKRLEECGYLVRKRTRDELGRLSNVEWTIYDCPHLENQSVDFPNLEIQPQSNTKESNTNESTTKEKKKVSKADTATFDSIIEGYTDSIDLRATLIEFLKMRQRIKKPMTNYALNLLLKKLDKLASSAEAKMDILNQSIINGWQDVYALKPSAKQADKKPKYENAGTFV